MIIKGHSNKLFSDMKKRRETINITESEYYLPQKIKSPKTQKKQSMFLNDIKTPKASEKASKFSILQSKKYLRASSMSSHNEQLTPKKLNFCHIDAHHNRYKILKKSHSISLVDTPKKLNLKRKTQQALITLRQKDGCKKMKYNSKNKPPLKIQKSKINSSNDSGIRNSERYSKKCQNYDIYYGQGSTMKANDSKKSVQHQRSSKTLRLIKSSNKSRNIDTKNVDQNKSKSRNSTTNKIVKHNKQSQYGLKQMEENYRKMYERCNEVLKSYNEQLNELKCENQILKEQNLVLKVKIQQKY